MPTITAYLDDESVRYVRTYAKRHSRSVSAFVRLCVESWVKRDLYVMPMEEVERGVREYESRPPWKREHLLNRYKKEAQNDAL